MAQEPDPAVAIALLDAWPARARRRRSASAATLEATYSVLGAEIDPIARGAIPVGRLPGHRARIRLLVGAALGRDARSRFPLR